MSVLIQNTNRLLHLLELFKFSKNDLLHLLNVGRTRELKEESVFSPEVKVSTLKAVDNIFCRGLAYYIDPEDPVKNESESIFFRKDTFNTELNLTAKQVVNRYEQEKISYETLLQLSDVRKERILKNFTIKDSPLLASEYARELLYPSHRIREDKAFLRQLITNLASFNILVLEYVEHPRLTKKANIAGFYLSPDVIVIKWQKHLKREIFTLAHELGHYLLNAEDIDNMVEIDEPIPHQSIIEAWCNDFAFSFLAGGENYATLNNLQKGTIENDYHHQLVAEISKATHLSELAIYTKLLKVDKISSTTYTHISNDIKVAIERQSQLESAALEQKKLEAEAKGNKLIIPTVKPITSPLYIETLQIAFNTGLLSEYEFCTKLNISANSLHDFV